MIIHNNYWKLGEHSSLLTTKSVTVVEYKQYINVNYRYYVRQKTLKESSETPNIETLVAVHQSEEFISDSIEQRVPVSHQ